MPCDTVTKVLLKLENADPTLLKKALTQLQKAANQNGYNDWLNCQVQQDGSINFRFSKLAGGGRLGLEAMSSAVKVAYSQQVVNQAAENGNWMLDSWSTTQQGQLSISAERRSM